MWVKNRLHWPRHVFSRPVRQLCEILTTNLTILRRSCESGCYRPKPASPFILSFERRITSFLYPYSLQQIGNTHGRRDNRSAVCKYANFTDVSRTKFIAKYRLYTTIKSSCSFTVNNIILQAWWWLHNEELNDLYSSLYIVRVIKSRRMRWAGHVARMGEERGVYRVLVGKPEGRIPLGRPRRRWVDNIRMDLQEVGCGYMDWIGLAQNIDRWRMRVR